MSSRSHTRAVKTTLAAAVLAVAGLAATTASAGDVSELRITYKKYELETLGAAGVLYRRIDDKVRSHCEAPGVRTLHDRTLEAKCRTEMLNKVIAAFDNQRLSSIHEEQTEGVRIAKR